MLRLTVLLLTALSGALAHSDGACHLSSISVVHQLDECRFSGVWYESHWYPSEEDKILLPPYPSVYGDYSIEVRPESNGLFVTERERSNRTARCSFFNRGLRVRVANAKYKYTRSSSNQQMNSWIVDTNYDTYMIQFLCSKVDPYNSDICLQPGFNIFTRHPNTNVDQAVRRFSQILGGNSCVRPSNLYVVPQSPAGANCVLPAGYGACYPGSGPQYYQPQSPQVSGACQLNQLPVVQNLDECRLSGVWYESHWYASEEDKVLLPPYPFVYADYSTEIRAESNGLRVVARERASVGAKCDFFHRALHIRVGNAKYQFTRSVSNQQMNSWIVDTNYDTYMIQFMCSKIDPYNSNICLQPSFNLLTRRPNMNVQEVVNRFRQILGGNSCVKPSNLYIVPQGPAGSSCAAPAGPGPCYSIYPNVYGPQYYNTQYYDSSYFGHYDAELVKLHKEVFVAEKEMLEVQKELVALEKERLRLGGRV